MHTRPTTDQSIKYYILYHNFYCVFTNVHSVRPDRDHIQFLGQFIHQLQTGSILPVLLLRALIISIRIDHRHQNVAAILRHQPIQAQNRVRLAVGHQPQTDQQDQLVLEARKHVWQPT